MNTPADQNQQRPWLPRVWLPRIFDCFGKGYVNAAVGWIPEDGDMEYLSVKEHEAIVREKDARISELATHLGLVSQGGVMDYQTLKNRLDEVPKALERLIEHTNNAQGFAEIRRHARQIICRLETGQPLERTRDKEQSDLPTESIAEGEKP